LQRRRESARASVTVIMSLKGSTFAGVEHNDRAVFGYGNMANRDCSIRDYRPIGHFIHASTIVMWPISLSNQA